MPAMLRRAGLEVSLLHDGAAHAAASSHLTSVTAVDGGPAAVAAALAPVAGGYDRVVVLDEPLISALLDRGDEPWVRALLPSHDVESARALVDKTRFARMASEQGLPRPASAVVGCRDELLAAVGRIGFPLVVKGARGQAGSSVRGASDTEAALAAASDLGGWPLLVERMVTGPVALVAGVFAEGRLAAGFVGEKLRTVGPFGPSAVIRVTGGPPEAVELARRAGEVFALEGFASLDMVLSPERGPVLIEINPRPVPMLGLARRAGADLGAAFARLVDGHVPEEPLLPTRSVTARQFPQELQRLRRESGRTLGTLRWALDPRDWRELPWGDPGLMRQYLR